MVSGNAVAVEVVGAAELGQTRHKPQTPADNRPPVVVLLVLLALLVRLAVGLLRLVPRPHPSEGDVVEACNSTPNTMPNDALIRRARPKTASRQIVFRPECRAS
jgi:hypothetical protein